MRETRLSDKVAGSIPGSGPDWKTLPVHPAGKDAIKTEIVM